MDKYWEIYGNKYDLSEFVKKHPGGRRAILSGKGRDCTALFESYHPWNYEKACNVLSKYGPKIEKKENIYSKLRILINTVMTKKESKWNWFELISYNLINVIIIYLIGNTQSLILSLILGMCFSVFAFRMIHEAGHFSVSTKPWVNDLMQWPSIVLGGSVGWHMQHVIGHHIYTNLQNDPDTFVIKKIQKQSLILRLILYILLIPFSIIQLYIHPIFILINNKTVGIKFKYLNFQTIIIELGLSLFLNINLNWTLSKFLTFIFGIGIIFFPISQFAHFTTIYKKPKRNLSWVENQIFHSLNFETNSRFWNIFSFGLTTQIEHHIFPSVSQTKHHLLSKGIKEICQQYDIPYQSVSIKTIVNRLIKHIINNNHNNKYGTKQISSLVNKINNNKLPELIKNRNMYNKYPSITKIKKWLPKDVFDISTFKSMTYAIFYMLTTACCWYGLYVYKNILNWYNLLLLQFITGSLMFSLFTIAHDCGHETFSNYKFINNFMGDIIHSLFLSTPYYSWKLSHLQHHLHHNHNKKDFSFSWVNNKKKNRIKNKLIYKMRLLGPIIGWPLYIFAGIPDGGHFIQFGRMWKNVSNYDKYRSCLSSLIVFFSVTVSIYLIGFVNYFHVYIIPWVFHGWWLVTITYLHHHSNDTSVFTEKDWSYIKGAFETVDRKYGYGFDQLFNHITDGHVVHHLYFNKIPHYNLKRATIFLREKMFENGYHNIYKHQNTPFFWINIYTKMFYKWLFYQEKN